MHFQDVLSSDKPLRYYHHGHYVYIHHVLSDMLLLFSLSTSKLMPKQFEQFEQYSFSDFAIGMKLKTLYHS